MTPPSEKLWQRMEMGTPQQDQIKNKEKLIKNQDSSLKQQNIMIDLIEKVQTRMVPGPEERNEFAELIRVAKENIISQQEQIQQTQAEIENSKKVATHYSPSLQRPPLYEFTDMYVSGTKEALEAKNIRAAIESFNPEKHLSLIHI